MGTRKLMCYFSNSISRYLLIALSGFGVENAHRSRINSLMDLFKLLHVEAPRACLGGSRHVESNNLLTRIQATGGKASLPALTCRVREPKFTTKHINLEFITQN